MDVDSVFAERWRIQKIDLRTVIPRALSAALFRVLEIRLLIMTGNQYNTLGS